MTVDHISTGLEELKHLARTGRHAEAIELAGQALSNPDLAPDLRLDLLDQRAGSYIALGEFDQAGKDARAMLRLANKSGDHALVSQALIRKSNVQTQVGDLQAAVRTAGRALKAARKSGQKRHIAAGHLRLGWSINRIRADLQPALEHARPSPSIRSWVTPGGRQAEIFCWRPYLPF
jgi:tetratricopeptide (TPR) repeat protein